MLLDLVVPGAGSVVDALGRILSLCEGMREGQEACQRLHARLSDVLSELKTLERQERLPSSDSLAKYTAVLSNSLHFLTRYGGKKLILRLIQHKKMMDELHQIHEDLDTLLSVLHLATTGAMIDWKQQWEADRQAQEKVLAAMVATGGAILSEVQDMRSQMETIMLCQFEMEKRSAQQTKETMTLIKSAFATVVRASKAKVKELPPWFMPSDDVKYEAKPFDCGSFGSVHRGVWGTGTNVVVKCIPSTDLSMSESASQKIVAEIDIWYNFNHPNVAKIFGASHVSSPAFIVCEDATNGNLCSYLSQSPENKQRMWRLLYQAVLGLEHIHKSRVVHGDLKLNNILVGADDQAKVSDFGLSAVRTSSSVSNTSPEESKSAGGLRWRAPECLKTRPTFASDVYSFAMCIIEAVQGEPPFAFLDDDSVRYNLRNGELPEKPVEMSDDVWQLVISMTYKNYQERIPLSQVLVKLKALAEAEEAKACEDEITCCSACNAILASDWRFCSICGARLGSSPSLSAPSLEHDSLLGGAGVSGTSGDERGGVSDEVEEQILALIRLLRVGSDSQKEQAATALKIQALHDDNKVKITDVGGIPPLVALMQSGTDRQKEEAAGALSILARHDANEAKIADAGAIPPLVALVRGGTNGQKYNAARALRYIARRIGNTSKIRSAGGITPLVSLLRIGTDEQKGEAAWALCNLASHNGNKATIADEGGIWPLVELVRRGTDYQKECAATTLAILARHDANKAKIADAGAISPLVTLVRGGTDAQKEEAVWALKNLATHSANKAKIVDAGVIPSLVALVRSGTDLQKVEAAVALEVLAVHDGNQVKIADAGGISPLVALMRDGTDDQIACSAWALKVLAAHVENQAKIVDAGGISLLVELVQAGTDEQKEGAAAALQNLAYHDGSQVKIADAGGIPPLVALVQGGTSGQKEEAAVALGNLSLHEGNTAKIVSAGGVSPLVALLRGGTDGQKEYAAAALQNLSSHNGSKAKITDAGSISPLVALARDGTDNQKQYAAGALANLANYDGNRAKIADAGGITPLVALTQGGTNAQKDRAAGALRSLALHDGNKVSIANAGGILPLVVLVAAGTDSQKLYAAGTLRNLADHDGNKVKIVNAGGILTLEALVQSGNYCQRQAAESALAKLRG